MTLSHRWVLISEDVHTCFGLFSAAVIDFLPMCWILPEENPSYKSFLYTCNGGRKENPPPRCLHTSNCVTNAAASSSGPGPSPSSSRGNSQSRGSHTSIPGSLFKILAEEEHTPSVWVHRVSCLPFLLDAAGECPCITWPEKKGIIREGLKKPLSWHFSELKRCQHPRWEFLGWGLQKRLRNIWDLALCGGDGSALRSYGSLSLFAPRTCQVCCVPQDSASVNSGAVRWVERDSVLQRDVVAWEHIRDTLCSWTGWQERGWNSLGTLLCKEWEIAS